MFFGYDEGGARLAGFVVLAQLIPAGVLGTPLGSLGDRFPRGSALSATYAVQGVVLAFLTFAFAANLPIVVIVTIASVGVTVGSLGRPIHFAALSQLSTTPKSLTRSYAASDFIRGVSLFVGPVVAGLLVARIGYWAVAGCCAIVMLCASGLTTRLNLPVAVVEREDDRGGEGALAAVGVVIRNDGLRVLMLLVLACAFCLGSLEILSVSYADEVLNGDHSFSGVVMGSVGIGGAIGAALASVLVLRAKLAQPIALGLVAGGLPLLVMTMVGQLPLAVLLLAVGGAGIALALGATRTLVVRITDARILTRVFSVQESLSLLGAGLGAVVAPVLIEWLGASDAYAPLGLLLIALAPFAWLRLRRLGAVALLVSDVL